jgi:hypothetical protein
MKHVLLARACSTPTTITYGHDNPCGTCDHVYQVYFRASMGTCHGPLICYLTDWLLNDFLETVLPGLFEHVPLAEVEDLVSVQQNIGTLWGRCLAVAEMAYPGRWEEHWGPIFMASSVDTSNSDRFFSYQDTWRNIYAVPSRTIEDLVHRLQAAMTMVDANMLCSRECPAMHCCMPRLGSRPFEHLL